MLLIFPQYSICMLCLLILQIAFIVVVWVKKDDIINGINTSMTKAWDQAVQNPADNYLNVYQSAVSVLYIFCDRL